ncbi:MAG: TolC family protein [Cycloclasticus sp.]|nr:TolC family protein [Cycloclasticus sp.]
MKFFNTITLLLSALLLPFVASATEHANIATWVNQVVTQHPRLQAAIAATEVAKARARAADQPLFNPEIEFEYESTDVDTKTAGISQTIDWGDKRSAQTRIATFRWQHSINDLQFQQQQLSAEVLLALARYQASVVGQQVASKRMDSMATFISIAKLRYGAGDLTEVDLSLAQLASSEANFQLADAQSELIANKQALLVLIGNDVDSELTTLPLFENVPDRPKQPIRDIDTLLDSLPQMKLARAQMDIARAEIKLRQREQRPNPTIGLKTGKEGNESLTNITFSMPLFVRNNFSAEVDAANSQLIQRQREAIDIRRLLAAKLETATQTLAINRRAWSQWESVGSSSLLQQESLLERLWRAGELSTTDYLVQLKQSLDTQASAIEQKTQLWQSWTQWLIASGEINQWLTNNDNVTGNTATQSGNGE